MRKALVIAGKIAVVVFLCGIGAGTVCGHFNWDIIAASTSFSFGASMWTSGRYKVGDKAR